jgi:acyl-CoA reductase-like NAD-dependent aldehyde dehydrogenase
MAETDRERRVIDEVTKGLIIGGSVRDATEQKTFGVEDPSTGELLCDVADASPEDGMVALKAAHDAQPEWAATAPRERGEILRRAFELITERADDIALIMTLEMGKPLAESKAEITYAVNRPSSIIALAPAPRSSAGCPIMTSVPLHWPLSLLSTRAVPMNEVMWMSCAQACITPTSFPYSSVVRTSLA